MNKLILCLIFVMIALTSLVSVCASDINDYSLETGFNENNVVNIPLEDVNYANVDNINDNLSQSSGQLNDSDGDRCSFASGLEINGSVINSTDIKLGGIDIYGPNLNGLQERINRVPVGLTLDLYNDFHNGGKENKIIYIHNNMTINGHAYSVDFGGRKNCYIDVDAENVIFKNMNFINGFNDKSDNGGALYIHNDAAVTFENCTFCGNFARKSGGAVYCDNDKLTLLNCRFYNNTAGKENGGAVFSKGPITARYCIFSGNGAKGNGGAFYCDDKGLTCAYCEFYNNNARNGNGGAMFSKGAVTMVYSVFHANHAKKDGGAAYGYGNAFVEECLFEYNGATGKSNFQNYGGAICCRDKVSVYNSTFRFNKADDYGGAIYSYKTISNYNGDNTQSFFINNSANDEHGGALYAGENVECRYSVFLNNSAVGDAGAIYVKNDLFLVDVVVSNNPSSDGNQIVYGGKKSFRNLYMGSCLDGFQFLIDCTSGWTLNLAEDFNSCGANNQVINIAKSIVVDGHGHSVDFGGFKNCYIDVSAGNVTFRNMNFINAFNDKNDNGGAFNIHKGACVTFENCTFCNNFARTSGGAVYCDSDKLTFRDCRFYNNTACKENGGAVFSKGAISIIDCIFSGNSAKLAGGALYACGSVNGRDVVFFNNSAYVDGGAIYVKKDLSLVHAVVSNNPSCSGRQIACCGKKVIVDSYVASCLDNLYFIIHSTNKSSTLIRHRTFIAAVRKSDYND